MAAPEFWTTGIPWPGLAEQLAVRAEEQGWDGMNVVDSQHLAGDPYVGLALAARETERLKLGTGVTNPVTRHPAATAAAIASVHMASDGRAVLGIGRGDSALAHLGKAPAPVALLERALVAIQSYLRGDEIAFDELGFSEAALPPVDALGMADAPAASALHWLPRRLPKVPVEVAATGPRTIAVAAHHADRVLLALGADVERVRWGVEQARATNPTVAVGAFVNVVTHPDLDTARTLIAGGAATFARFSVMHGEVSGPANADERAVFDRVHDSYDMNHHTQAGSAQSQQLTPEFLDTFGVVGSVDTCVTRLTELAALGLEKFVITGPTIGSDPAESATATQILVRDVLPALRE